MDTFDPVNNSKKILTNLDLLEEKRNQARIREAKYKEAMTKNYNARVRKTQSCIGDLVLRNNEASRLEKARKLEARLEGPDRVVDALSKGTYPMPAVRESPGLGMSPTYGDIMYRLR